MIHSLRQRNRLARGVAACGAAAIGFSGLGLPTLALAAGAHDAQGGATAKTTTPIEHVIIIVGENRTFDHVFGTYQPPKGQTISNLVSRGIVNADGTPGPNFAFAAQYNADAATSPTYNPHPAKRTPYTALPAPNTGGAATTASDAAPPPFATLAAATQVEGASLEPQDIGQLTTGATGLPKNSVDTRFGANTYNLPNGPFQISRHVSYDAYINSPVHRFYQAWQQADCNARFATIDNPSGCRNDLFPWVETTIGGGSNGKPQPAGFTDQSTHEGATAMGFYNVNQGDMPYFTQLARAYAISDNYHQPVMGGTGANSIMIGAGDLFYHTDGQGHASAPPANQIENPNPQPGTHNWYTQDGYSGGSYSNCSDLAAPGVGPLRRYLASLPYKPNANCAPNSYYLLNNYNPGYLGDGSLDHSEFTIPPSPVRTIGDTMLEHNVSWKYYGEGWNDYIKNPAKSVYCNICNPFLYETSIMTNRAVREAHLQDTANLYQDIGDGKLPAVSFVKPGGLLDGHPTSSKFGLYEAFVRKIVDQVQRNPKLWSTTAIFVTVDEGGGYYDSGYIQPVDFFGDGSRIPMIVVSPFVKPGKVAHGYNDHVSMLKFIERNWSLPPITSRSRDNLPNPIHTPDNPYVPVNAPAIGDMFDLFTFGHGGQHASAGGNAAEHGRQDD